MRKKYRHRLVVSIISGLAFLLVFVLSIQNPPQKRCLRMNIERIGS